MIKNSLKNFPQLRMSVLPTPIKRLDNISEALATNIYCMRDDLTGFGFGGNKTRKLDFLIADALQKKANTLIAIGANQSNFCRIAAAAGVVNGLQVHLVLGGKIPEKLTGNLLINNILGASIHHVDTEDDAVLEAEATALENELTLAGRSVYRMPSGGSTPIGVLGYVAAFGHIANFSRKNEIFFDYTFLASGSAGTQAGLVVGQSILNGWEGKIIGVSVGRKKVELEEKVYKLAVETGKLLDVKIERKDVIADDAYIGEKYAARTESATEAIRLFAQLEGIFLDEVYTGKAAAAMIDYARNKRFKKNENVLFIHTGGNIQLFE